MRLLNRTAGRLSRHRRGPLAGLAVLLLGLLISGSLYTAFSPAQADSQPSETEQVAEGKKLFLASCSFCHGQNGEGVPTVREGYQLGPSLVGVGAAAVDFQVGTGRMPMASPGAQAPRKPAVFSDEETAALAAYVASLGPGPAIPNESDYSIEGLSEEEREEAISRGGQIFFSNGNLAPEEKRDVIAYLDSIGDTPEYAGFTLGGLGPVSEGMFAWLIGIGGLVGSAVWIASHTTRSKKAKVEA